MDFIPKKWFFLAAMAAIIWGGVKYFSYQKKELFANTQMPAVESALNERIADAADDFLCVQSKEFPLTTRTVKSHWVKLENGLSECRREVVDQAEKPCYECDAFIRAGLVEESQVELLPGDEEQPAVHARAYNLTEDGKRTYFSDIKTRSRDSESTSGECTPGEVGYHAPESEADSEPKAISPGFCFGETMKLHKIIAYEGPITIFGKTSMEIYYQAEVVNPDSMLSDHGRLSHLLSNMPLSRSKNLYNKQRTTAEFKDEGKTFAGFKD